ncbi:hypothetical protein N018_12670 [Pseudomonas syringae CC1557]|uniref:Uncharacterized protein n=1 Tax=Pseudomonas syringae CC1557 TaxID=1357279 RepID=W0MVH4_PSESX|nr:hypothetical protein N018_12670 [Pseudomonas syringae CC1557]
MVVAWSGAFAGSAVASDKSSGICIAKADFRQGSPVETQTRISNARGVPGHNKTETLDRQSFAGANSLVQVHNTLINNATECTGYAFVDLVDGKLVKSGNQHGSGASLVTTYNESPLAVPSDLQPGQTVTVSYLSKTVTTGPGVEYEITEKHTYIGREAVTTPLATFDACKFPNEISSGLTNSKDGQNLAVIESWFAFDGSIAAAYRNFFPAHGGLQGATNETIKSSRPCNNLL